MTKDLTNGSPFRLILSFAFPVYLGMLFQQFYNIVDTVIVGQMLGVKQLAGVGSTGSLNFMVIGFCIGVCSGFAIPIAQKFGAREDSELRRFVANSLWLTAVFSLVLTALVAVFCKPILKLMNTQDDFFDYAYHYIFIIFLGIPFTFLYNILAAILRSLGDSKTPVKFLALSSCLNIGLDLLFIKVFRMDVEGPALATVISQAISGAICFVYMQRKYTVLKMTAEERQPVLRYMGRLCYMGVPMGLQYSVTAIGTLIVQTAMNGFGYSYVAGATAAQRIHGFIACPVEALGSTMAPYTGQNMGAEKYDRIGKGTLAASLMGFAASISMFLLVLAFGRQMVSIFLDEPNPEVIGYAYRFLFGTSSAYCLLTLVNVVRFSIQGMGYSVLAISSGAMEMVARAIAGLVLAPRFGFTAICFAHPLAWLFADSFLLPAFFICKRRVSGKRA